MRPMPAWTALQPADPNAASGSSVAASTVPQQRLYFTPDPHQQGSLRAGGQVVATPSSSIATA
jgi:hypothetical protein